MKIAIVGSGISGLTAAHFLHRTHQITVFEAGDYVGGHAHTLDVEIDGERHAVDTGFIVYNDWTYPNYIALLDEIGVASRPTTMSFSVHCAKTGLEYCGSNLNGLFAQRRNLVRPGFYKMLADILRFNRESCRILESDAEPLVSDYLREHRYGKAFINDYFVPMGSAIWSCPRDKFESFPVRFVVEFFRNHGLLSVMHRPTWRTICGGSRQYVEALSRPFRECIRLKTPVLSVRRRPTDVAVRTSVGEQSFDHVVFACHSDQALRILGDVSPTEREVLSAFPYEPNVAVLHTDTSVLPRSRRAWAAWNYHVPLQPTGQATVTYNMNILQGLQSRHTFCVTLNEEAAIDPNKVLAKQVYHHPVFTSRRREAQKRHPELINANRTSFCGAYWGNGFHEDGVNSARAVCAALPGGRESLSGRVIDRSIGNQTTGGLKKASESVALVSHSSSNS